MSTYREQEEIEEMMGRQAGKGNRNGTGKEE